MKQNKLYFLLIPLIFCLLWQTVYSLKIISPLFVPQPLKVLTSLFELIRNGDLLINGGYTIYRVLTSFILSIIIGVPIGLIMGYFNKAYKLLEFIVDFFRSIPVTALFPLFLLFFGVGETAKISATVWSASLIILVNSMYGVHLSKELRFNVAKTLKIKGLLLFRKIILPEAMPQIFNGLRIAISTSLIIVVVTEMFIGTKLGLGKKIIDSQLVYHIPEMYVYIITTGVIGYLFNRLIIFSENKIVHWKRK